MSKKRYMRPTAHIHIHPQRVCFASWLVFFVFFLRLRTKISGTPDVKRLSFENLFVYKQRLFFVLFRWRVCVCGTLNISDVYFKFYLFSVFSSEAYLSWQQFSESRERGERKTYDNSLYDGLMTFYYCFKRGRKVNSCFFSLLFCVSVFIESGAWSGVYRERPQKSDADFFPVDCLLC